MIETAPQIDTWACLELMGHVRVYGKITEEEHFGQKLGRIEIPTGEDTWQTQFFGGSSVYRISPCDEETARKMAGYRRPQISQYSSRAEGEAAYGDRGESRYSGGEDEEDADDFQFRETEQERGERLAEALADAQVEDGIGQGDSSSQEAADVDISKLPF